MIPLSRRETQGCAWGRRELRFLRLHINPRKCIIQSDNSTALRSAHRLAQGEPGKFYERANEARNVSIGHVSFRESLGLFQGLP